jgi:dipeptidyl aminopeptidase/acylaminoacyl peptidase
MPSTPYYASQARLGLRQGGVRVRYCCSCPEADWGARALQGIWIVSASNPDGVTQAEAQRVTTLPKGAEFDFEPQFSPDGSRIAFTRFKNFEKRKSAIHVVATDGSGLRRLTPWKLNASHPDWAPDGQRIAFDSSPAA